MKVDCGWIEQNLESYFCDKLTAEEDRLARSHIENCAKCREEIRSFTALDPVIRKYFQRQLTLAQNRKRRPAAVIYGGVTAAAIAAMLLVAVLLRVPELGPAPIPSASQPQMAATPDAAPPAPPVIKNEDTADTARAKPDAPSPSGTETPEVGREEVGPDAPEFLVIDPAGYSRTLQDFRGYTLVLGVWNSENPESIDALERIYQAFSTNTRIRILGVSNTREAKPANTTFPIAYNQGSRLLNAAAGEFALVDPSGSVLLRGSLTQDFEELASRLQN